MRPACIYLLDGDYEFSGIFARQLFRVGAIEMNSIRPTIVTIWLAMLAVSCMGQQIADASLPDSPDARQQAVGVAGDPAPGQQGNQSKRIFGIFPNYRAVYVDQHFPPQSVKNKFVTATQDSFDYSAIVLPGVIAAEQEETNATPEFHKGAAGYGRYFWHTALDQTSENYFVEFVVPSLTHEDTRYYALGKNRDRALHRAGYALSRLVITRDDHGHETVNAGELLGAGLGAGVSNLYYPAPERTVSKTMNKYATNLGVDAFTFLMREFWPDANHILFHGPDPRLTD
jgi:hypothetical protein